MIPVLRYVCLIQNLTLLCGLFQKQKNSKKVCKIDFFLRCFSPPHYTLYSNKVIKNTCIELVLIERV